MINMAESLIFAVQEFEKAGVAITEESLQQIIYISSPLEVKVECFRPGPQGPFAEGLSKVLSELKKNGIFKIESKKTCLRLSEKFSQNISKNKCLKGIEKGVKILINNNLTKPSALSTISKFLMVRSANLSVSSDKKLLDIFEKKSHFLGWGKANKAVCKKVSELGLLGNY